MSKRVKKRFNSSVNVIDFQTYLPVRKHRVDVNPRNKNQQFYLQQLQDNDKNIVIAVGPAGTGKTIMAVQYGICMLQEGKVDKIIITRPAVSVDEDIGFLPGTLQDKMAPWTRPIFDVLGEYYSQKDIEVMLEEGIVEISPLAYMRGRTFKSAYIIADEMQNATPNQMKMLLTRIGDFCKMVVTGDLNQADRLKDNGLINFIDLLREYKQTEYLAVITFDQKDIERHHAVKEILAIYGD